MKNKRTHIIAAFLSAAIVLTLGGCGNSTGSKALEEGKLAMANSDYKKALNMFNLAENEGVKGDDISEMIGILEAYIEALDSYNSDDIDSANAALSKMSDSYVNYTIKNDVDTLKSNIELKQSTMSDIDSQIIGVRKMLSYGDYESAGYNIDELKKKNLTDFQRNQVDEIEATLNSANKKISDASVTPAPKVVYEAPPANTGNNNVVATYYVVNCTENVTLRNSPSTQSAALAKVELGKAVGYIENAGNGFTKVNYDGKIGYILSAYLSSQPSSYRSSDNNTYAQVVNANEYITLRVSPSTDASEITKIPVGTKVVYLGAAENGFYKIRYNGTVGYSLSSYLKITGNAN